MPDFNYLSKFASAPFVERDKGYGERLADDLGNLSLKQTLGLPVTAPLTAGAGALDALSFGLLDFGDELQGSLGEFALPDTAVTALDIAGQIGGSFVPYIGSSALAGRVFTGLSAAAKIGRGAITFGAPELARQALTQEFDPLAAARSTATGAAFALPLPRIALGPAVAGTELLFGAEPTEAAAAGLFATILGPMGGRNQELPVPVERKGLPGGRPFGSMPESPGNPFHKPSSGPSSPLQPSIDDVLSQNYSVPQAGAPAFESSVEEMVSRSSGDALQRLADQSKYVTRRQREAYAAGQMELPLGKPPAPKSQLELLDDAVAKAQAVSPKQGSELQAFRNAVTEMTKLPEDRLMAALHRTADELGPESPQAAALRYALAEVQQGYVPPGAPLRNVLKPPARGLDLVQPGPTNPFEVRSQFEDLMLTLRSSGAPEARTREAQLWDLLVETRQRVARLRGRGQELPPAEVEAVVAKQEKLLSDASITFNSPEEAYRTALMEMATASHPASVDSYLENLPEYYHELKPRLLEAGKTRKLILQEVEEGSQQFRKLIDRQPEGFRDFMGEASDMGLSLLPAQRQTVRGGKPRTVIDKFTLFGAGSAKVKQFNSIAKGRQWLRDLEAGVIEPASIHEARALAHGRGIVIENMGDSLMVTNQLTGETVQGIETLEEAVRIVRDAPNVVQAAREFGPRVTEFPPLPGTGGFGGHLTEQSPPLCPLVDLPE